MKVYSLQKAHISNIYDNLEKDHHQCQVSLVNKSRLRRYHNVDHPVAQISLLHFSMSSGSSYRKLGSESVYKEFWARYLELFLKFGEPSTKDENFLRAIVDILKLLASLVILL